MVKTSNFTQVLVSSAAELRSWLEKNHAREDGIWIVTYKKGTPDKYVSTGEVLDELLSFGWIDGVRRKHEENPALTMQLITPRKAQHWTKTYKDRAAKLETEGRMAAPGRASIDRSKASGM